MSLRERQEEYEDKFNSIIIKKLPIIIRSEVRNFKRLTNNLDKPFSHEMSEMMANAMLYAIVEIQDAVFGYQHSNEMTFILRNDLTLDQEPWCQNNIQAITSTVSSLLTIGFYRWNELCNKNLNLVGDAIFKTKVFALPHVGEVVNHLIWRQLICANSSVTEAAQNELDKIFDKKTVSKLLHDKMIEDKIELLLHHCGINIYEYYPDTFLRGIAAYKVPVIVSSKDGGINKNKWILNYNIPNFIQERDFVTNILNNGKDIYRVEELDKINIGD